MAREYIDELGDGTINPETSGVDSQATDNGTHVKTLAPIYYTPATIANDGKATRGTPVTIKSALDAIKSALNGKANGMRWTAVTKGQTWSRLFYSAPETSVEGSNGILAVSCTRGSVVCNATFLITASHNGASYSSIIELASCDYTQVRSRLVVSSIGNYYFEVYDTAQSITSSTTQRWHCTFVPLLGADVTTYTEFTDGTTIPTNYTATNDFTTTGGNAAAAIKNITRSGTTFTATRQDGSTFTFTQQDSNTDTKVTATAKANTDNANYKILATASASPTSGAATEAVYDTDITLNPSTNTITANISGNAATATTATNFNTSSGTIKSELEGKASTSHTHSVSINGSTKTIAASGGTAVDLGTYKVFNYAKVYTTQIYNANTNRYIMLAFNAATYTTNWEESSMFKLVVHDGQFPKELVFRLWLKGGVSTGVVPADPSDPKLYRVYSENFSESALNILDVRLFVVEKSAGSIQFTIGIFIDRNYLQGQYISYQLYPLSYGTRDRGNVIDNGLSNWTYTVGNNIYRSNQQHSVFTTAFAVNDLSVDMSATKAVKLSTARKLAVSLSNTSTDTSFDGSADVTNIKTTGILPVSNGGTGRNSVTTGSYLVGNETGALTQKTAVEVAHNVLTNLPTFTTDNVLGTDYIISSNHAEGVTDATKFVRRTADKLWNYIKDRISSVLGLTATNYGGNAATATTVTSANITRTADTTNGDKLQIGSGTAVNVVNSKSTLNVAASAASTNTNARHIWFSDSSAETKREYNDDLTYRTDYNRITTNISGYATGLTNQRGIQHQGATTNHPVHRIASYPSPNITAQGRNADNSLVLHLFTKGHNASDYGIVLITVKLADTVSNNPAVNVRWKLRSSGMPTDAVQAAFIKDGSGMWHVDVFFIVQHQYQLTVFNKLGSFSALDGSPNGGWVLYSSNVDSSYADGKECYTDISGDDADTASKRLYNSIGYIGAATGITDDGIVGTANTAKAYDTSFSGTNSIHTALTSHNHGLQISTKRPDGVDANSFSILMGNYNGTNTWKANLGLENKNSTDSEPTFWLASIRSQKCTYTPSGGTATSLPWYAGSYSPGITFGGKDTKGVISLRYDQVDNYGKMTLAAGSGKGENGAPGWWFSIRGLHNTTYILPPMGTGDNASKYAISIVGTAGSATVADKLANGAGGIHQPVYIPASGTYKGIPQAIGVIQKSDNQYYVDMPAERAYAAVKAGGLSLSSAVGSGTHPVYFNEQGAPVPISYKANEEYLGNPVLDLTVTKARNALYVNGYSLAVGSYGGVSNTIYFS